jgi:hypothetical protein
MFVFVCVGVHQLPNPKKKNHHIQQQLSREGKNCVSQAARNIQIIVDSINSILL